MSATLFTSGKFRAFSAAGVPLVGGLLYSYLAGTGTLQDTYTDQSGNVANTNPVVLDANGEANVWLNGNYKFTLKDSNSVLQWTVDDISDGIFSQAFSATSTTSLTIGSGSKTFITQSGKSFSNGQFLIASSAANTANYMLGSVTSYSDTTLTLNVLTYGGSGVHADWNISLSGTPGPQGPTGATGGGSGDVNGPASAIDGYIALFDGTSGKLIKKWTSGPGSAAALTAGTSALNVVQLDGSAKLPAVDGSALTGIVIAASAITSGTVATARLGSGSADATTFLRGDQTYATPTGSTAYQAVGTYLMAVRISGSDIAAGATAAGSSIQPAYSVSSTGAWTANGSSPSGTWRNMSGLASNGPQSANLWVRTA